MLRRACTAVRDVYSASTVSLHAIHEVKRQRSRELICRSETGFADASQKQGNAKLISSTSH